MRKEGSLPDVQVGVAGGGVQTCAQEGGVGNILGLTRWQVGGEIGHKAGEETTKNNHKELRK